MTEAANGFHYGAVYFRATNPPREDWSRDYATAAEDGFTSFRHWFMWSAVEYERGIYDWTDYDAQLDLAAQHGLKTVIAEHVAIAPEWLYPSYPHARYERADGSRMDSVMQTSSAIGGAPGLCLDNEDVRELAGRFLSELVTRYRDHPGTAGYDVWNECNVDAEVCFCDATAARFRDWLKEKYGDDVSALRTSWSRYYSSWDEVRAPRKLGPYGQTLDWLSFRRDNAHALLRWRVELIRSLDPVNPITAHGVAGSLGWGISRGIDDWAAAEEVDSFGFTFVASRRGDEPWKQPLAVELVRSASRGKPFWHAEAQAGPLWLQPQVVGRPLDDGRVSMPEDIRYWNLVSMAGGVSGVFYPRWRPLLDGPLFGAFGGYGMDGSRTDRSREQSRLAKWSTAPENADLWAARPATSEVGVLFVPESQAFAYALRGSHKPYEHAISGAWRALYDRGFHPALLRADDLATAKVVYLPFPMLLPGAVSEALIDWVGKGGTLLSDGAPGWFADGAHASPRQPRQGLAELFGVEEESARFTPDLLHDLRFSGDGFTGYGGELRQSFRTTTGAASGWYDDDDIAVADNTWGKGRTRLAGTHAGTGYYAHPGADDNDFFADSLRFAGLEPPVRVADARVRARLHDGEGGSFLWILNPTREPIETTVRLSAGRSFVERPPVRWGESQDVERLDPHALRFRVGARDGLVVQLAS